MVASSSAMNDKSADRVSLEAAQSTVVDGVGVLPGERVPLREALGRVIRQDVVCDSDCPSADVSAVDGYSFASQHTACAGREAPLRLRVVGTVKAGSSATFSVGDGECAAIMTGGPLPAGADTVVPAEDVEAHGDLVVLGSPPPPGSWVARLGDFVKKGETIRLAGRRATPQVLAVLAASGASTVSASRRPRVGVLATGDELVGCETVPGRGRVRASNLPMLAALASEIGCDVADTATVGDSEYRIAEQIRRWEAFDAIVTSGGASMGKFDLVPGALRAAGAEIVFSRVRMRPGGRTLFGRTRGCALFCLPGSPMGALVAFVMIARPGLLAMMGSSEAVPAPLRLRTTKRLDKRGMLGLGCPVDRQGPGADTADTDGGVEASGRKTQARGPQAYTWFVTARCVRSSPAEGLRVEPIAPQGSRGALVLASATCLLRVDEKTRSVERGRLVDVFTLRAGGFFAGEVAI